jgi:hypothetical protein
MTLTRVQMGDTDIVSQGPATNAEGGKTDVVDNDLLANPASRATEFAVMTLPRNADFVQVTSELSRLY